MNNQMLTSAVYITIIDESYLHFKANRWFKLDPKFSI